MQFGSHEKDSVIGAKMKLIKLIFYIVAIVTLVVTCDNVQAIRDKYVETPSFYEESIKNILSKGEKTE